ncbi:MAG: F0F1 ATP synthase subunit A [Patescibacteria group bacterium]|jgi:F-type H+-transporting ATPase subunit a
MHEISLAAEHIFSIGSFSVTNSMIVTVIISILIIVFAFLLRVRITTAKKISKAQNAVEMVFEGAFSLMDGVTNNHKNSKRFFALVMTLFIFILLSNWSGLIPGVGPIGIHEEKTVVEQSEATSTDATTETEASVNEAPETESIFVPLFRAPSSDLNTTIGLAIISLLSFQVFGIATIGFFKYLRKFLNFKGPIEFFLGILEIVSELAKMISLSFRLFGNVFAGEVLLLVIAFLVPIIAPLPFFALEIFVGLIQAFIFAMLTLVFLTVATMDSH